MLRRPLVFLTIASLAVVVALWVPDVRAWFFLLAFWAVYGLVLGSPFILVCLVIWYLVRRVDRAAHQNGFDVVPLDAKRRTS